MAGIYTYQNLLDDTQRDAGSVTNVRRIANRAARFVAHEVDLRSMKRKAYLSPALNENQYDYQSPADLKELALIDVRRVDGRQVTDKFNLTQSEYFDRNKSFNQNLVCIEDHDYLKKLRVSADVRGDDEEAVVNDCDSLTDNGTWAVSGDASNLSLDTDVFINSDGSLNFDSAINYTSLLLTNSDMDAVDLSDYEVGGSVYAWVWIPDRKSVV